MNANKREYFVFTACVHGTDAFICFYLRVLAFIGGLTIFVFYRSV